MKGNNCKATEKNKRETLNCESLEQVVGGTGADVSIDMEAFKAAWEKDGQGAKDETGGSLPY